MIRKPMTKIQKILFENQDLKYRDFHSKLMPTVEKEKIIGVRIPILRSLAKDLYKNEPELVKEFLENSSENHPHEFYEENNLHAFFLEQIKDFDECINLVERFLPLIDNWATCDSFRPKVFKKNLRVVLEYSKKWMKSKETYTIRFGIGCLMNYFLDKDFKPEFFDLVLAVESEEYYVKMMKAWYFATALGKQPVFALKVIEERKLDQWTHNKTIQKAIESYRVSEELKLILRNLKM